MQTLSQPELQTQAMSVTQQVSVTQQPVKSEPMVQVVSQVQSMSVESQAVMVEALVHDDGGKEEGLRGSQSREEGEGSKHCSGHDARDA